MNASGAKESVTITMPQHEWQRIIDNSTKYTEMVKMLREAKEHLDSTTNFTFEKVKVEKLSSRHSAAPVVLDIDTESAEPQPPKSDTSKKSTKNHEKSKKRKRADSESSGKATKTSTSNEQNEAAKSSSSATGTTETTKRESEPSVPKKTKVSESSNDDKSSGKVKRLSVEKKAYIVAKFIKKTGESIGTQPAQLAKIEEFATGLGHNFKANNIKLFISPIVRYVRAEFGDTKNQDVSWEAANLVDYFNKAKEKNSEKKNNAAEKAAKKSAKESDSSSDSDSDDNDESSQPAFIPIVSTKTQPATAAQTSSQQSLPASQTKPALSKSSVTSASNNAPAVVKLASTDVARKIYEENDDDHSNMESSDDSDDSDMVDDSDMEPDDDEE